MPALLGMLTKRWKPWEVLEAEPRTGAIQSFQKSYKTVKNRHPKLPKTTSKTSQNPIQTEHQKSQLAQNRFNLLVFFLRFLSYAYARFLWLGLIISGIYRSKAMQKHLALSLFWLFVFCLVKEPLHGEHHLFRRRVISSKSKKGDWLLPPRLSEFLLRPKWNGFAGSMRCNLLRTIDTLRGDALVNPGPWVKRKRAAAGV